MGGERAVGEVDGGSRVRLLICDDHRVLTDALVAMVRADGGFELVAPPVHSPAEAIDLCAELQPDVVLMDVSFEGTMTGIEATSRIRAARAATSVVIMTAHHDDRLLVAAVEAGAAAYLRKTEGADRVLDAARAAATGAVLFDPAELASAMARVARERDEDRKDRARFDQLTDREREVLDMLSRGDSNQDIAERLVISPFTVQTHVGSILRKLGVRSKTQAVALALNRERD